ncbi:hypothetical protein VIGAN_04026500 [Vigna angularis var. angularis]|uniref:Uncharacterized protein n=1 Tax=Vigna angularis var. angularis TaxID=157739 RepID=A0A0S3RRF1_PHAAN|nr:hypothetical protein VIGAN_04026500 [Vigna angularis var. angularis]
MFCGFFSGNKNSCVPYGGTSRTNENEASSLPVGQNAYKDGYSVMQVCDASMCYTVLGFLWECIILVHCLIFLIFKSSNKNESMDFSCFYLFYKLFILKYSK